MQGSPIAPMTDLLLAQPLGAPGSARVRYGAAMALHRAGRLDAAALEVYRICASLDGQDPAAVFAERGLALPQLPPPDVATRLRGLLDEADTYLAGLPGPGVAEVRLRLAAFRTGPCTPAPGPDHPVVAQHLAPALAALHTSHPALAAAIADAAPLLHWAAYDAYPRDEIGAAFADGHAFASLLGEAAPIPAQDFDLGLFLIAPGLLYRDHAHAAPELYAPLTGPHGWRFGPGRPLVLKPAHQPVWNLPERPHLTKVGALPFLCLFAWTREVNSPARVIPADDWPALEALTL